MIIDVDAKQFRQKLPTDPHPFVSEKFTEMNAYKVDRIVRLIQDVDKVPLGLVAGVKDNVLLSPFSAPFGGFHYKNENIYPSTIDSFLAELIEYARCEQLKKIHITLPPDLYSMSFNAKTINSFVRLGFQMEIPDTTNWVELKTFNDAYTYPDSRTYYNQAVKHGLSFQTVSTHSEIEAIYELIVDSRVRMERPIYMTLDDVLNTSKLFPTDFLSVTKPTGELVAGAIFYRINTIAFAVFWGDAISGRSLRAMDFMAIHLWSYYKKLGFHIVDLGKSSESGVPNEGLLRFKETHECVTSLKYTFTYLLNE
ncbi:MAG: hypothetical protein WCJ03_01105 [Bacteroidales bacterium]